MKSWFRRTLSGKGSGSQTPPSETDASVDALIASGQALEDEARADEALSYYMRALDLNPRSATAHLNAGNAYRILQNNSAALDMYRRATELDPGSAAAQLNLGTALLAEGMPVPAEQAYRAALRLRPDWAEAWVGLGCALEDGKAIEEATAAYSRALAIQPDHVGAATNLSDLQIKALDVSAARETLSEFLRHAPGHRPLMQRLASVEESAGRLSESLAIQRSLVEQNPDDISSWSVLLFNLCYLPDLTAEQRLEENRRFGHMLESKIVPRPLAPPASNDSGRRLRIGYMSGDFNIHPIANFIHPVLRHHDRENFEVFCYHTHNNADQLTIELKGLADHWQDVAALDDDTLADMIQRDRIDVLVDLSGHSGGNRLGVFARKPAPAQFTWLGYLGTTGLTRMDYRLCDAHTDPVGVAERWQTEIPARLPDSQWCYDQRLAILPAPSPLPRLQRGYWTFGSFNNYRKLNHRVFTAWAEVLRAIPDSQLQLFSFENQESAERAIAALAAHGIERDRIHGHLRTSPQAHFESFAEVDVALDSFPYNGATTTCDALLMGVPVLVVAGACSLARGGVSLLNAIGMPDWIAESELLLPSVAKRQLADVEAVARLRAALPQHMRSGPLMDTERFTRNLEAQYRLAWRRWCESTMSH